MEVNKIDSTNLLGTNSHQSNKKSGASSAFATLLAQKKSSIRQDLEDMQKLREEIKFNQDLHEELTGEQVDEPIDDRASAISTDEIETIKHILPDGSIILLQVQENQIISQTKIDADDLTGQLFL